MRAKVDFLKWSKPPTPNAIKAPKTLMGWAKIRAKLETKPGKWALIRVSDKRPVYTHKGVKDLEIVTRQFMQKGELKFGTWARVPESDEVEAI